MSARPVVMKRGTLTPGEYIDRRLALRRTFAELEREAVDDVRKETNVLEQRLLERVPEGEREQAIAWAAAAEEAERQRATAAEREAGILPAKFRVERTDGSSAPGGKHEHCFMFVLDTVHDPYAKAALTAYADACREKFPELARELLHVVRGPRD